MTMPIGRIDPSLLAQILGPEEISAASPAAPANAPVSAPKTGGMSSPFEDILQRALDSLEGVSKMENQTNVLINQYIEGKADLSEVMIATSKMSLSIQLAVATVTSAVNTFKEITQMQI